MNTKKVIVPIIISVATLILLTVGATYAYFSVNTTNNFGTKTITTSAESIGNVALSTGNNLILDLSAKDMMNQGSDLAYYASSDGTTTTPTIEKIGTATVTGEGIYNCTYKITMNDNSSSMYDVFQGMSNKAAGQIILTVNGIEYDFNTSGLFSKEISGTMYGITSEEARDITASLKIVNKTSVDQSALAGSNITITFSATSFECNAVEDRLPNTYQEVEYLQSAGTQYLEIDYIASSNTITKGSFQLDDVDTGLMLFGSRISSATNGRGYAFHWGGDNKPYSYYNTYNRGGTAALTTTQIDLLKHTFEKNKNKLYIDNNIIHTHSNQPAFVTPYKMIIFGCNTNGKVGLIAKAKIFDLKFYDNNVLRANLVPCYRKSDNVRGMYDLVENKFYTNKGTGTFGIGSNI